MFYLFFFLVRRRVFSFLPDREQRLFFYVFSRKEVNESISLFSRTNASICVCVCQHRCLSIEHKTKRTQKRRKRENRITKKKVGDVEHDFFLPSIHLFEPITLAKLRDTKEHKV